MDKHRQLPDSTQPDRGIEEDSLSRPVPASPVEGQRTEPARGVERESLGPQEDLPERESMGPEEDLPERGNRSEETI
jgi:hypothetical protein